uniref:Leucine-rich repeat protein n=1 Tax=Parastrongyloides trichosuri TaxID=131310 RepID=A0A0N4ZZF3_PARTI
MITVALLVPRWEIYIKNFDMKYGTYLFEALENTRLGEYNKIDIEQLKNESPILMRITNNNELLCFNNFDLLKSLTLTIEYNVDILLLLEQCRNIEELSIIGAFKKEVVSFEEKFYHILKNYTKLLYFTLSKNYYMKYDGIKLLLRSLPNKLFKLSLEDNGIEKFPNEFGKFTNLFELNIGKNNITEIPTSLLGCKNLSLATLTTKETLITFMPIKFWSFFFYKETNFGSYTKQTRNLKDSKIFEEEVRKICDCNDIESNIKYNIKTLTDICLKELSKIYNKYNPPEHVLHIFEDTFICDSCNNVRKEKGHKCYFKVKTFICENYSVEDVYGGNSVSILERTKICRYCIS